MYIIAVYYNTANNNNDDDDDYDDDNNNDKMQRRRQAIESRMFDDESHSAQLMLKTHFCIQLLPAAAVKCNVIPIYLL